ncbi:hypothetical protein EH240_28485 [Mesorhizobium tamadayense]|uniref:Uncharacterized protein n=1 Tax=Mesorhizobium tamadayense TaxID=425306 RepID=A0A3P3F6M4_9HYPH|nr:hypothetical protein [Mesorhizobium tamadayense]RRH93886.1 hypothetical protein EH240_28485 [Mesorhizobium tamadayense]
METARNFFEARTKSFAERGLVAPGSLIDAKSREKLRFLCDSSGFQPALSALTTTIAICPSATGVGNL